MHPTGRRTCGGPRTHWRDYIPNLAWGHLRVPQEGVESVAGEQEVCDLLLLLLPPQTCSRLASEHGCMSALNIFFIFFFIL